MIVKSIFWIRHSGMIFWITLDDFNSASDCEENQKGKITDSKVNQPIWNKVYFWIKIDTYLNACFSLTQRCQKDA